MGFDDCVYLTPDNGPARGTGGGGSQLGRVGLRLETLSRAASGQRIQGCGIVNLACEFLDSGAGKRRRLSNCVQRNQRLRGELGPGGT